MVSARFATQRYRYKRKLQAKSNHWPQDIKKIKIKIHDMTPLYYRQCGVTNWLMRFDTKQDKRSTGENMARNGSCCRDSANVSIIFHYKKQLIYDDLYLTT